MVGADIPTAQSMQLWHDRKGVELLYIVLLDAQVLFPMANYNNVIFIRSLNRVPLTEIWGTSS